jgi:hypothetical protein
LVSVGDRDAAGYDVLAAPRPAGVALLIRAAWHRGVHAPQRYEGDTGAAQPVVAQLCLHVPRRGPHPAREAPFAWRFGPLPLRPPQPRKAEGCPTGTRGAVQGYAGEPPAEGAPIEWRLLTTVAVETVDDAIDRGQGYSWHWGLEVWHRILQSGGHLEARHFQTAARFRRALPLYRVLAWRIFFRPHVGAHRPGCPLERPLRA